MVDRLSIDHVGYAVRSIHEALDAFARPLLAPEDISPIVEDPIQNVRVAFVTLHGGGRIEYIEPLGSAGPLQKLLADKRGGLYHVCYATPSLEQTLAKCRGCGCVVVSEPAPARAFGGRRVAFVFTPSRDLVEFVDQT